MLTKMRNEFIKTELVIVLPAILATIISQYLVYGPLAHLQLTTPIGNLIFTTLQKMPTFAVTAVALVTLFNIYKGLFSNEAFTAFSFPEKKSGIIFARTLPSIIIGSLSIGLIATWENILIAWINHKGDMSIPEPIMGGLFNPPYAVEMVIDNFCYILIIAGIVAFGLTTFLLAYVKGKSASNFWQNFVITGLICILSVGALFTIYGEVTRSCYERIYAQPHARDVHFDEWYATFGFDAIVPDILYYLCIITIVVGTVIVICLTKKAADKKMNIS